MNNGESKGWQNPDPEEISKIIRASKTIAVVGMSSKPDRASHRVGKYLMSQGFNVIPVNPRETEILGRKCYSDLNSIEENIDLVDIFRKSDDTPPIVGQALASGVRFVWLQEGIISQKSYEIAEKAGIPIVMDRCLLKEHKRLKENNGCD